MAHTLKTITGQTFEFGSPSVIQSNPVKFSSEYSAELFLMRFHALGDPAGIRDMANRCGIRLQTLGSRKELGKKLFYKEFLVRQVNVEDAADRPQSSGRGPGQKSRVERELEQTSVRRPKRSPVAAATQQEESPDKFKYVVELAGLKKTPANFSVELEGGNPSKVVTATSTQDADSNHRRLLEATDLEEGSYKLYLVIRDSNRQSKKMRLLLADSVSTVAQDVKKAAWETILVPVLPVLKAQDAQQAITYASVRQACWLAVFVDDTLWREVHINESGLIKDIDLELLKGKDERAASGMVQTHLVLPYKINGSKVSVKTVFSDSQLSWSDLSSPASESLIDIPLQNYDDTFSQETDVLSKVSTVASASQDQSLAGLASEPIAALILSSEPAQGELNIVVMNHKDEKVTNKAWKTTGAIETSGDTGGEGLIKVENVALKQGDVIELELNVGAPVEPPAENYTPPAENETAYPQPLNQQHFMDKAQPDDKTDSKDGKITFKLTTSLYSKYKTDEAVDHRLKNLGYGYIKAGDSERLAHLVGLYQRVKMQAKATGKVADIKDDIEAWHDAK